jgi:hypothetical protein
MSQSEVARLRAEIERQCEASWSALHGLAWGNAQHAFISARLHRVETCHQLLSGLIGDEQATEMVCEVFDRVGAAYESQTSTESSAHVEKPLTYSTPKNVLSKIVLTQEGM